MPTSATDVQPTQPSALTPTLALTLSRNVVSEHLSRNVVSEHESISSPYSKMYPKTTQEIEDRLERLPRLPKWFVDIAPAPT
jgi:hypothetical protein